MLICRKRLILVLGILVATVGNSLAQSAPDLRRIRWGYSKKQVREAEEKKPTSTRSDKLIYAQVPLGNRMVGLEYEFNGDSLLSASYYYYVNASITQSDVVAAATEFEALLTEKYGPGKSAKVGEIKQTLWMTPRTRISLALGNVDKGWSVELVYLCRVCSGDVQAMPKEEFKPRKEIQDF
ncbi:hypothetical protein [Spirosoma jeollabukense]